MSDEVQQVKGSFNGNEVPSDNKWFLRIGYRCLFCTKRHKQLVTGDGQLPSEVVIEPTCKRGEKLKVVPYRQFK